MVLACSELFVMHRILSGSVVFQCNSIGDIVLQEFHQQSTFMDSTISKTLE